MECKSRQVSQRICVRVKIDFRVKGDLFDLTDVKMIFPALPQRGQEGLPAQAGEEVRERRQQGAKQRYD